MWLTLLRVAAADNPTKRLPCLSGSPHNPKVRCCFQAVAASWESTGENYLKNVNGKNLGCAPSPTHSSWPAQQNARPGPALWSQEHRAGQRSRAEFPPLNQTSWMSCPKQHPSGPPAPGAALTHALSPRRACWAPRSDSRHGTSPEAKDQAKAPGTWPALPGAPS